MVTWEVSSAAIAWMFMAPNKNGDDLGMVQMAWGKPTVEVEVQFVQAPKLSSFGHLDPFRKWFCSVCVS